MQVKSFHSGEAPRVGQEALDASRLDLAASRVLVCPCLNVPEGNTEIQKNVNKMFLDSRLGIFRIHFHLKVLRAWRHDPVTS